MKYLISSLLVITLTFNVLSQATEKDKTNTTVINRKTDDKNAEVYLNSAEDTLFLGGRKSYFIYDAEGKLLIAGEGESVDISSLQGGGFTIETFSDGKKTVQKFEKEVLKENVELKHLNKNIVYLCQYSAGLEGGGSINYERIFKQRVWNKSISTFWKITIGSYKPFMRSKLTYSLAQIGILTGKNRHHLEISGGISHTFNHYAGWTAERNKELLGHPFSGNIGWRIQKPDKHFVFRMGVGVPELLYFGLGLSY